ncbi:MAG: nicotinate-nucleotide adenylyltransferase [Algibacter sp.]|uniref:nicotinate-nucleotide adenylyltransferase n=1 Tax=Algibacter sp. TaxID=1872428 RepID=UPI002631AA91|nr:nicotinate-nucleotide adenylyltransferase [Algibacter sp.]MDG1729484.1 nicotinate-nucleotide adenylyltransferase [Algibacter sp.]MDG2178670.1 nicotinate-nucleotide adenylyltransferase [Algibacter sp.]
MKKLVLFLLVCGLITPVFAQIIVLDTVEIRPIKYKYLFEVVDDNIDQNVKNLQTALAKFDVRKEEYYSDDYDNYSVTFRIPEGYAIAAYDEDGKLIRTIERYKNVKLPLAVSQALAERFPNWAVDKDIYKVSYSEAEWDSKKIYKLKLTNGEETVRVKTDEDGNFL